MKKLAFILLVAALLLAPALAEEGDAEDILRRNLSGKAGTDSFPVFCYGDYDGDGAYEAFAISGYEDEDTGLNGEIWFVNQTRCERLRASSSYLQAEASGGVFSAEEWFGGSGSTSYAWYVKNGAPRELSVSGLEGFTYDFGNQFSAYPSAFDMYSDGTGHTWKRYYYYFDPRTESLREYGGLAITVNELLEFEGAEEILNDAVSQGWNIGEIYYRANGVINVNVSRYEESYDSYDNLTLHYDDARVVDTDESFSYGGNYDWANSPDIADVPRAFVHPVKAEAHGDGLDVFEFDRLSSLYICGTEMQPAGECERYLVYLREGVNSGGSDGYYAVWPTEEGILSDWKLDLDGDGAAELLTCESTTRTSHYEDYSAEENVCNIVVYEKQGGGYVRTDAAARFGDLMPMGDVTVRVVDSSLGRLIFGCYYAMWDGAVSHALASVWRYSDGALHELFHADVCDMGDSWFMRNHNCDSQVQEAVNAYIYEDDASGLKAEGLALNDDILVMKRDWDWSDDLEYSERFDRKPFEALGRELQSIGLKVKYQVSSYGNLEDFEVEGGSDFLHINDYAPASNATEIVVRTSMDHKPVMFTDPETASPYMSW